MNNEDCEFKPGEKIEVSHQNIKYLKRIFIQKIGDQYLCVYIGDENAFKHGNTFSVCVWHHARKIRPDLKVDDKVLVRDNKNNKWYRRYFKQWNDDKIECYNDGKTSWTGEDSVLWNYWKLPEDEDNNE